VTARALAAVAEGSTKASDKKDDDDDDDDEDHA
jgi:hypothetical protein